MRTLVIDTATEACSVALFDDDALVAGEFRMLGRGHAEQLVPMIAALPGRGRADRIAVNTGPGSFTGIRVGLAAARALQLAWGAKLYGYGSGALVAAMARADEDEAEVDIAMTAGHGEWFFQRFADGRALDEEMTSLAPSAAAAVSHAPLVAGTQAEALVAARGTGRAVALWPDARRFALLASAELDDDPHPAYGRAPDVRLPGGAAAAA
ncbi:tRNA (adenosine(37)-N6)-threonylcarbamoyltransferase complex dimerization subunit type 1 TsaB [Novosphingobium tardum]|uniref:tRNA (Adenosine(37)-N6)-threonylcarbamoyltransferase complex dimerization subunit type 1 TsaB n=1 Tax=Novosphingobium tardum TaxID=1538021 RepID=A0ABV8RRS4_9SPHN